MRWERWAGGGRAGSGPGSASSGRLPSGRVLCFPLASCFGERWVDRRRRSGWEGQTCPLAGLQGHDGVGAGGRRQEVDRPETEGWGGKSVAPGVSASAAAAPRPAGRGPGAETPPGFVGSLHRFATGGFGCQPVSQKSLLKPLEGLPRSQEMHASSGAPELSIERGSVSGAVGHQDDLWLGVPESSRLWLRETLTPSSSL